MPVKGNYSSIGRGHSNTLGRQADLERVKTGKPTDVYIVMYLQWYRCLYVVVPYIWAENYFRRAPNSGTFAMSLTRTSERRAFHL